MRRRPVCILWLLHRILEAAQIDHTHIRHIQQVRIIELTLIKLLIHRIKALLHTVCADMDQKASGIHHLRGGGQVPGE